MAQSGPCREPLTQSRNQKAGIKTRSDSVGPAERLNDARSCVSGLREIQFHADAVGIVEKELRVAGARHDALAEFHVPRLQPLAHALDIAGGEGDVIEPPGV